MTIQGTQAAQEQLLILIEYRKRQFEELREQLTCLVADTVAECEDFSTEWGSELTQEAEDSIGNILDTLDISEASDGIMSILDALNEAQDALELAEEIGE